MCLKGSDTNATTECFCLLLLAIHQDIQVGTNSGVPWYTTRGSNQELEPFEFIDIDSGTVSPKIK